MGEDEVILVKAAERDGTVEEHIEDGKVVAEGSIWRLYFAEGATPTEAQLATIANAIKATIIAEPTHVALVTPTEGN